VTALASFAELLGWLLLLALNVLVLAAACA
jgi:hypothetical protein